MTQHTPLKIGLSGTHCCGKTSLITELKKHYATIPIITELASRYPPESRSDFKTQLNILNNQIAEEAKYKTTGFLSDRTVIDNIAYCYYHYSHAEDKDSITDSYAYAIKRAYAHILHKNYDIIFYISDYFPHDGSSHRDLVSQESQYIINEFLNNQFKHLKGYVPIIKISGNLETRIATIKSTIATFEKQNPNPFP